MSASKLIRPSVDYKDSYLEALREYHKEGRYLYEDISTLRAKFEDYIQSVCTERGTPHQPFQEWVTPVPETIVWLVKDDDYVGTVNIRHRLNWHLERWGGHIHFAVRPSARRKGYGRKILLKSIPIANYLGVDKALLTVAPDNAGGIRVLEACGAVFSDELPETDQFPAQRRYWLDCT